MQLRGDTPHAHTASYTKTRFGAGHSEAHAKSSFNIHSRTHIHDESDTTTTTTSNIAIFNITNINSAISVPKLHRAAMA